MHPALSPLADILALNCGLLLNALDGMDDMAARRRITPESNSAAFLALHLIESRHYLAALAGAPQENPYAALIREARGLSDLPSLPPLRDLRIAWREISDHLHDGLAGLDGERLAEEAPQRFPIADRTLLGAVAFLVQHDSYHVGQVALLRRQIGLPAVVYPPE